MTGSGTGLAAHPAKPSRNALGPAMLWESSGEPGGSLTRRTLPMPAHRQCFTI